MEKTCKTCKENDCGLCDRTGRLVEDDDQCEKWTGNKQDVGRKENDSKLLLGLREAERNCNTIHKSMGR